MRYLSLNRLSVLSLGCALLAGLVLQPAQAGADARDLTVEFRQVLPAQSEPGSYSAGSEDQVTTWEPYLLQVRNGEKAQMRLNDAVPMQWVQSASAQSSSLSAGAATPAAGAAPPSPSPAAGGASASIKSSGAAVTQALAWFDAGQSMSVQVNWNPAKAYAVLKIEVQQASFNERVGADLPRQSRALVATSVRAPLAQWVTIAASGAAATDNSYRSDSGRHQRRLLQVRVMAL